VFLFVRSFYGGFLACRLFCLRFTAFPWQAFDKFVEIGRVILLKEGPQAGEIAVILDIIDLNRVLVQGAKVPRQPVVVRRCKITDIKITMPRGARNKTFTKLWTEGKVEQLWSETAIAKKMAREQIRKNLTDFDRFKVSILKKKVRHSQIISPP